jgi:hypothetical protein
MDLLKSEKGKLKGKLKSFSDLSLKKLRCLALKRKAKETNLFSAQILKGIFEEEKEWVFLFVYLFVLFFGGTRV